MFIPSYKKFAAVALGSAALAACSGGAGSQGLAPSAAPAARTFTLTPGIVARPDQRSSWMKAAAAKSPLLYVSDAETYDVYAYSWPGLQLVGTLSGFNGPTGECVDKQGDLWVVNTYASNAIEFAHGGTTPINTLSVAGQYPYSCAVDDKTGDLAIGNIESTTGAAGSVTIFAGGSGTGVNYPDKNVFVSFVGYKKNTLYVDGGTNDDGFSLQSFANGKFKKRAVSGGTVNDAGGVQYAKNSLTIGDQYVAQGTSAIYQVSGSGSIVGMTPLNSGACGQYVIDGKLVVCPNNSAKNVLVYAYPAGGVATSTITGSLEDPFAAVISR
jgi:hypothetical protein